MKVLKFFGNLIGVLLSIVVSLALLVSLIAAPMLSGATELVQSDTLVDTVQSVVTTFIRQSTAPATTSSDSDLSTQEVPALPPELLELIDEEMINQILETDLAEKLIDLYLNEFTHVTLNGGQMNLDIETVKALVEEHMDEILPLAQQILTRMGETVSDQEIRDAIYTIMDEVGQELLDSLPTPEVMGIDEDLAMALSILRSNVLRMGVIILIAVLSILILLFRFPRFKGFMWNAVVYILGALLILSMGIAMTSDLPAIFMAEEPEMAILLNPIMAVLAKSCFTWGIILLVLAVVFILIFAFGRKAQKKRKARKAAAAEGAAPASPAAPAAPAAAVAEEPAVAVPSYVTKAAAAAEKVAEPVAESAAEPAAEVVESAAEPAAEAAEESEPEL